MFGAMLVYIPRRSISPLARIVLFCALTSLSLLSVFFINSAWPTWTWVGTPLAPSTITPVSSTTLFVMGTVSIAIIVLLGLVVIPLLMDSTIYAFEHMTRNLNGKIDTLKLELTKTSDRLAAQEQRSFLLASFNPSGTASQCKMAHFARYLGTTAAEEKDPSIDEWIQDDFSRSILTQHAAEKRDDETIYFIMAVHYFKLLPTVTEEEQTFCLEMARSICDRFVRGDCEINMSSTMSHTILDRLSPSGGSELNMERLKSVFDSALRECKKLVTGNTLADMRKNGVAKFRVARNFIFASRASMQPPLLSHVSVAPRNVGNDGSSGHSHAISVDRQPDSPAGRIDENAVLKF